MKKLLSLAVLLCLALLPVTALAADGATVYVGNVALIGSTDSPAYVKTNADTGAVTAMDADENNYNIKWDGETLTLQNATIKEAGEYPVKNNEKIAVYLASGNMNLVLVGENTVDALGGGSAASCGIHVGGSLTIRGQDNGSLSVYGGPTENGNSCGIYANGTITIESGSVNATGESASAASYGIDAVGAVTIGNGTVKATSGEAGGNSIGIHIKNSITINGGDFTATAGDAGGNSYGIHTDARSTSITVNGGTVNATSGEAQGDSCGIFAESRDFDSIYSSFSITGGSVTATGGDAVGTGWYSCGIKVDGKITISGGTVNATAGDALKSGGNNYSLGIFFYTDLTISGGEVTGIGGTGPLSCGIVGNYTLTITGGTVVGKGGPLAGTNIQYSAGINGMDKVEISGGTVTATGGTTEQGNSGGIYSGDTSRVNLVEVTIKNATVTATGGAAPNGKSSGIFASNAHDINVQVTVDGGTVTATGGPAGTGSYGILAETTGTGTSTVTINGNSVVRANTTDTEGVVDEPISGDTINRNSGVIFENGVGIVYGNVTLREDLTVAADETLTVPEDAALTIPEDTTLTVEQGGTLTVEQGGTLTVEQGGTLTGNVSGKVVYAVTVLTSGSGSATASVTTAAADDTVTLTASPSSGYHFERWEVVSGGVAISGNQFTMPAQPVTVRAVFESNPYIPPTYAVTTPETTGGTVTVSPSRASSGRTVTITASPYPGFALESLTVLDSRGEEITLTDKGDGKYTFTMPASKVTVEATFAPTPLPFDDVASGTWYEEAVRYVYFRGVMEGMSATTFQPNGTLTRAQAVQIFYNLEGQPDISGENLGYPYEDVNAEEWYGNAVYWARLTGVATGYGDGTFQPADSITRQEFAQMLYNYAKYKGYDLSAEGDLSQFPDSGSVADWAEAAMSWANGNELINGHDDGTIDAAGIGTRAQAAGILMRFDQNLVEN